MGKTGQKQGRFRTGKKAGIWLALSLALALHLLILLLPIAGGPPPRQDLQRPLELQLSVVRPRPPAVTVPVTETLATPPEPMPEQLTETMPQPPGDPVQGQTRVAPTVARPAPPETGPGARPSQRVFENLSELEKDVLTSTILARQYLTEESVADRLFGKPLVQDSAEFQREFHYPLRPDLLEMLDRPLPEVPFDYTPGLIYFAYDPGLKGDLQRFWDVITPEFGWRTKYGTEVKCALVLVIVGCVWK